METWKNQLERGKEYLFGQDSQKALKELETAMEYCPEENALDLSEILFFLGVAYRNLGHDDYAYRCWENAAMLRDRDEADYDLDWKAFYRIQLIKYLSNKPVRKFSSLAESDMIHDLIKSTWGEVKQQSYIMHSDFHQRCRYYRLVRIIFPRIEVKDRDSSYDSVGQIISFSAAKRNDGKK